MLPNYDKKVEKTLNISKYTPGKIRIVVTATNIYGQTIIFESRQAAAEYFGCSDTLIDYGRCYKKGNKKGWTFEKVEDIV